MKRQISVLLTAAFGALSLFSAGAHATHSPFPMSVNEANPSQIERHEHTAAAVGKTSASGVGQRSVGDVSRTYDSRTYEVQTPSSVNEAAPWLTGGQTTPTTRQR